MDDRIYHIRISPEVIKGDIFKVGFVTSATTQEQIPFCCGENLHYMYLKKYPYIDKRNI